jgi:pullulanase/glycogen debranching enzyme
MDACTLLIYYHRPDGCYRDWKLWAWEAEDAAEDVLPPQLVQPAHLVWNERAASSMQERGCFIMDSDLSRTRLKPQKQRTGERLATVPIEHWNGVLFQVSLPASQRMRRTIGVLPVVVADLDNAIVDKDPGGDRFVNVEAEHHLRDGAVRTWYLHQGLSEVASDAAHFGLADDLIRLHIRRLRGSRRSQPFGLRMQWTHADGRLTQRFLAPDCGWSLRGFLAPWESVFGLRFTLPRFLFQYWLEARLTIEPGTWNSPSGSSTEVATPRWTPKENLVWNFPLSADKQSTDEWYAVEDESELFPCIEDIPLRGAEPEKRFLLVCIEGLGTPLPLAVFDAALSSVAEISADAFQRDRALYVIDRRTYDARTKIGLAVVDPLLDDPLPKPQCWLQMDQVGQGPFLFLYGAGALEAKQETIDASSMYRLPDPKAPFVTQRYRRGCSFNMSETLLRYWLDQMGNLHDMPHFWGIEQVFWVLLRSPMPPKPTTASVEASLPPPEEPSAGLMLFEPHWGAPYLFPASRCLVYVWYRRYSRDYWPVWRLWVLAGAECIHSSRVKTWDEQSDRALFVIALPPHRGFPIELRISRDDQYPVSSAKQPADVTSALFETGTSSWDVVRSWHPTGSGREIFLLQGHELVYGCRDMEAAEQAWLLERYLEVAYLRPRFDYDDWHLWIWDADFPSSTGREVAPRTRAAVDAEHPQVEALIFRIDRGWFGPAKRLGFLAKKRDDDGTWVDRDGPDRFWNLELGVTRIVCLQGREQVVQSVDEFILQVTPYFENDLLELCFPFPPWWKRPHLLAKSGVVEHSMAADLPIDAQASETVDGACDARHFQWQGRAPNREPSHERMSCIVPDSGAEAEKDLLEALEVTLYWAHQPVEIVDYDLLADSGPERTKVTPTKLNVAENADAPTIQRSECSTAKKRLSLQQRIQNKSKDYQRGRGDSSPSDGTAEEYPRAMQSLPSQRGRQRELPRILRVRANPDLLVIQFQLDPSLDEDFPVENVMVHLRGFSPSRAAWRQYEHLDKYYYDGSLGWSYSKSSTVFRVFAPTAERVTLCLYREPVGTAGRRELPMRRIPQGVWKIVVTGDLQGLYYTYRADGANKRLFPGVEVIDPYSRCNTAHHGRGLIYGEERTPVADRPQILPEHTIIYEVHLRDFTIDERAGVAEPHRGKYLGLAQRGTQLDENWVRSRIVTSAGRAAQLLQDRATPDAFDPQPEPAMADEDDYTRLVLSEVAHQVAWTDRSTCLDHALFLGVNAIQIMPVQDFDNDESNPADYRWGYMPVHFFSPDGWYASCTTDASRVRELKLLIDALHRAGLKVILDMVLNHTAEDPNEFNLEARFSFNGLAPRYYYRFWPDGSWGVPEACYANGSGCGNEFRSESPMGRKFILDMLRYWATEYKVDGFRFDLMGLMDRETLHLAAQQLHAIDPNILIYGEPWSAGETPLIITGKGAQRGLGFGVFNDTFRNALRGSNHGIEENFLLDGGCTAAVKRGIRGSIDDFASTPLEVINYIECHDNRTLWDHLWHVIHQRADPTITYTAADVVRVCKLAAVMLLTSQGIPFLHSGQEMGRTKFGVENSYQSGDEINRIRWERKIDFYGLVRYVQGLIALRRARSNLFAMRDADEIRRRICFYEELGLTVPERCIAYRIIADPAKAGDLRPNDDVAATDPWRCVVLLFNPTPVAQVFPLPPEVADELMAVIVNGVEPPRNAGDALGEYHVGQATVPGRSAMVLRICTETEREQALVETRLNAISEPYSSMTDLPSLYSSYATPPWSKHASPAPMDE